MARGGPSWQAEGGAGVGGNEVGHGLRHRLDLDLVIVIVSVLVVDLVGS